MIELRPPQRVQHGCGIDDDRLGLLTGGDPRGRLPEQPAQLAFQLPDARLARVVAHHPPQHVVIGCDVVRAQAIAFHLTRPEVAAPDGDLLVSRVAVEANHLHPVEQRAGNRIGQVGRRDEQHVRQIERDIQVVILKRVILRRVQHLEQRRRRITAPIGSQFVDLVEQDHWIHRARVA